MGLKIGEVFRDYCLLTVTATGARATLLADVTCQVYDEAGVAFGAAIVATETSNGWYYAEFTPDAAGTWSTDWSKTANPENYTFHYPYKEFHVGAGQEADIYARLGAPAGASMSADILAIDNFVDDLEGRLTAARAGYLDELAAANLPTDVANVDTKVTAVNTDLGDFSGQANLQSLLAALGIPDVAAKPLYTCLITDRLDHATYGLSALETIVDDLEGRLTAARAGYLDKLANRLQTRAFFSPSQAEVVADTTHTDAALPTVTLPNISGTIVHVYAGFKFRMVENTNAGANKLSGAQEIQIQKAAEGWLDAIHFVDDQFGLAASTREGGDCIIGYTDLVATVNAFNDTYEFQWDEPLTDADAIHFNDVQTFLIVSYY